jgi:hypothetical protein
VPAEAELILFAIRSGIRLGTQARAAFVDSTRAREIALPLPDFRTTPEPHDATEYFERGGGGRHLTRLPRAGELLRKARGSALTPDEQREFVGLYVDCLLQDRLERGELKSTAGENGLSVDEWTALVTIRQWRPGADPQPTLLRRAAATLIEIGVDYFATVPGAVDPNSATGRALVGVLSGLQSIDFTDAFAPENMGRLPGRLLVAAFETVSQHPELLTGDHKVQELLESTAGALARDVKHRIEDLERKGRADLDNRDAIAGWAELVFRSVVGSGGRMVLSDPAAYLGTRDAGQVALVSQVGLDVLSFVLDQPAGRLAQAFSKEALDVVLKSALRTVGQHPELVSGDRTLRALLGAVASELAGEDTLVTAAVLPELARIVVEQTGEHLELVWPAGVKDPRRHLLLTAAKTTLAILSRPPAAGAAWAPRFGRDEVLRVTETVLDELVKNPAWLVATARDADANLGVALDATLDVLRTRGDGRLDTKTAVDVLRAAAHAVAMRAEFLEALPAGAAPAGRPLVAAAVDAVIASIFDPAVKASAAWQVTRSEAVVAAVRIALSELAGTSVSPERVSALRTAVERNVAALGRGQSWDEARFEQAVRGALA